MCKQVSKMLSLVVGVDHPIGPQLFPGTGLASGSVDWWAQKVRFLSTLANYGSPSLGSATQAECLDTCAKQLVVGLQMQDLASKC